MFNFCRNYKADKLSQAKKLILAFENFKNAYPQEADSIEYLAQIVEKELGLVCRNCFSTQVVRQWGSKLFKCIMCLKKGRVFAGTFFEKMRIAKLWHAAICLRENGIAYNAWQLSKLCDVAYSSALVVFRKIARVTESIIMGDVEKVPSSAYMPLFCKRSNQTPACEHPRFEEIQLIEKKAEEESVIEVNESDPDFNQWTAFEKALYDLIHDTPIHLDNLCLTVDDAPGLVMATLTKLELNNLIIRQPADYYIRAKRPNATRSKSNSDAAIKSTSNSNRFLFAEFVEEFVKHTILVFHGISRKYLQLYLAMHCVGGRVEHFAPGQLVIASLNLDPFTYPQMLEYVSPAEVSVAI